jgi:O-antigen ligase
MFEDASRIYSTWDNPNVLGEYLLFIIPLAAACLYYAKKDIHKIAAAVTGITAALCIAFTFSRGAWLGLLLAALFFVLLFDRRLVWFGGLGLLLSPLLIPKSMIERFLSIGNLTDGSTSYRVNIWLASLRMLAVFWPIGIGMSVRVFTLVYGKFAFNGVYAPHSHNLYLQLTVDTGVWGLLLFCAIMAVFFKNLLVGNGADKGLSAVKAALVAGMSGFLLQGMTDNVWYNFRMVCFFWLILSAAAIIGGGIRERESEECLNV